MLTIAHRGQSLTNPENTIQSFSEAVNAGAQWVELDIHSCASGELVVIHDSNLTRTTNGSGEVSRIDYPTLSILRAKGPSGNLSEQHIPTLEEVLMMFPNTNFCIEVKDRRSNNGLVTMLEVQFKNGRRKDSIIISSFKKDVLKELHQLLPDISKAVTIWGSPSDDEIALYATWGVKMIHLDWNDDDTTKDVIDRIHAAGLLTWCYTVNDKDKALELKGYGVDGIFSDDFKNIASVIE